MCIYFSSYRDFFCKKFFENYTGITKYHRMNFLLWFLCYFFFLLFVLLRCFSLNFCIRLKIDILCAGRRKPICSRWNIWVSTMCWRLWVLWGWFTLCRFPQLAHENCFTHIRVLYYCMPTGSHPVHMEIRQCKSKFASSFFFSLFQTSSFH